ncbi:MAG: hypothetical protein AB1489_06040 [Acidobacteriota bacterium]
MFITLVKTSTFLYLRRASEFSLVLGLCWVLALNGNAQGGGPLPQWLTDEEERRIEQERDEKDRTEELLKVSAARLETARSNLISQEYEQASVEIKNYGELIGYTVIFIDGMRKKEKQRKKLYKVFELALRRDIKLLEMLRYELPGKYGQEASEVYDNVRKAREQALGVVFGKDFFPSANQPPASEEKGSGEDRPKEESLTKDK